MRKNKQEKKEKKLSKEIAENLLKSFGFRGVVVLGISDTDLVIVQAGNDKEYAKKMMILAQEIKVEMLMGELTEWNE